MWKNQKMIQLHNKLSIADVTVITGYIIAVIAVGLWVGVYSFFFLICLSTSCFVSLSDPGFWKSILPIKHIFIKRVSSYQYYSVKIS